MYIGVRSLLATVPLPGAYHFHQLAGEDSHHILEASFKGMARALKEAVTVDEQYKDEIPSTKGVL